MTAITCWGDSLTFGTGSTSPGGATSFPSLVASLLPGQTVTNNGVPGETSEQILTRVLADSAHTGDIVIFWSGHNDDESPSGRPATVANIASMVAHLGANTKYLVLSMVTRTYEYPAAPSGGDTLYNQVAAINAALAAAYTTHYVDVLGALLAAGNPLDATDKADTALGRIPSSLRADPVNDSIHENDGAYAIVAKLVARAIWSQGWATTTLALRDVVAMPSGTTGDVLVVQDETARALRLPRNTLLRGQMSLAASYATVGYYFGRRASLDIQAALIAAGTAQFENRVTTAGATRITTDGKTRITTRVA